LILVVPLHKTGREEYEIIPECDLSKPGANGLFENNGVFVITGFKT